jgi:hypothetical protein
MEHDFGLYIALIAVASGAVVLGMSYVAAYMIGRSHGRREEARSSRAIEQMDAAQRIAALESTVNGLGHSMERMMDAQRLLVAQQDHLSRKVGGVDRSLGFGAIQGSKTPA